MKTISIFLLSFILSHSFSISNDWEWHNNLCHNKIEYRYKLVKEGQGNLANPHKWRVEIKNKYDFPIKLTYELVNGNEDFRNEKGPVNKFSTFKQTIELRPNQTGNVGNITVPSSDLTPVFQYGLVFGKAAKNNPNAWFPINCDGSLKK